MSVHPLWLLLAGTSLACAAPGNPARDVAQPAWRAAPAPAFDEPGERWTWRVAPYLWAADLDGDLEAQGQSVEFDVPFSDTLDNLDSAAQVLVEARRDRWAVIVDTTYLSLEVDGTLKPMLGPIALPDVDVDLKEEINLAGAGVLYRVDPDSALELGAGLRYAGIETEVDLGALPDLESDSDLLDGVVMARHSWPLDERWRLSLYGDAGAGDSDFTWQGAATLHRQVGSGAFSLGYRVLDYDVGGSNDFDVTFSGLLLGWNFSF